MLFIITFISIIIYGLLSEINWMDGWIRHINFVIWAEWRHAIACKLT